jgi:sugar-specific transcriptional regulator TrmB
MDITLKLQAYLAQLDIEPAAANTYFSLVRVGPASALQVAKATDISRTQTYRYLEALQAKNLVGSEQLSYGTLFRALPLQNIEAIIAERETTTATLKQDLPAMLQLVQQLTGSAGPTATTQHYYGLAGIKQASWNVTKANKEFRVFEVARISQRVDPAFARRQRERYIEQQLTSYSLTNDTEAHTADLEPFTPTRTFMRHIPPDVLPIEFEMYIYNDMVTLLDYKKGHEHALEVHHPTLHQMMFQLFEAMWRLGAPLEITE